jgi:hypothetical protein
MRKVEMAHRAREQLLERSTLDYYTGRRTYAQIQAFTAAFEYQFRQLQNSKRPAGSFGKATRYFFGLLPRRSRRVVSRQLPFGILTLVVQFDDAANQCKIESIELV